MRDSIIVSVPATEEQKELAARDQGPVADPASDASAGRSNRAEGSAQRPKRKANPPKWLQDYTTAR